MVCLSDSLTADKALSAEMAGSQDYFPVGNGFCRQKMLNRCDKNEFRHIVDLAKNLRLLK